MDFAPFGGGGGLVNYYAILNGKLKGINDFIGDTTKEYPKSTKPFGPKNLEFVQLHRGRRLSFLQPASQTQKKGGIYNFIGSTKGYTIKIQTFKAKKL